MTTPVHPPPGETADEPSRVAGAIDDGLVRISASKMNDFRTMHPDARLPLAIDLLMQARAVLRSASPLRDDGPDCTAGMLAMLSRDNRALKQAGDKLAEAALRVAMDYDGVHRLRIAIAMWNKAVADEGGRAERYAEKAEQ